MPLRLSGAYRSYAGSALFSLNYVYTCTCKKKLCMVTAPVVQKKSNVFNVHIVIIVQKRHCSLGKSSIYACNYVKSLALSALNMVYQKL